jgi:hypothetical protein
MSECQNCGKIFRDNYNLHTHLVRLKPCKPKIQEKNNDIQKLGEKITSLGEKITPLGEKITPLGEKITPLEEKITPLNKCDFCLNTYHCKNYKNKHQAICKHRDDPLRLLEIQMDICPDAPPTKTECRFCNHNFFNVNKLNCHFKICKDRKEYHEKLINKQKKEQQLTINNNGTINNGTINNTNNGTVNYSINVFGQESTDHVKAENLIQMLRDLSLEYNNKQVYLSAGEFINLVNRYIREVPENDNFNIPDPKGLYAEIKTNKGIEKVSIDRYLEKSFKSSAKTILDKKDSINEQNDRVFKSETNKEIFLEVKGFAKDGFRHTPSNCIGTPRQVRSGYKIGMLKKENYDCGF